MMPHCKRDSQFELFENLHPAAPAPKLALPFQRSAEVDMRRTAAILGICKNTVYSMLENKLLRAYRIGGGVGWRIEYDSIIEYCNHLRVHYRISEDRLLRKPVRGRLRDEDLLPFPLAETIKAAEVQKRLSIPRQNVIYMIEQGDLVGYQLLIDQKASPWRIYEPSVDRYVASLHAQAKSKLPGAAHR